MSRLIDETLEAWRDAERLLAELSPLSPEHETLEQAIVALRGAYHTLAAGGRVSPTVAETLAAMTRQHQATIRRIREEMVG